MNLNILGVNYSVIDTIEKITIADSFVVRANKIGTGNGEAKLYVGNNSVELRKFFEGDNFTINCFLLKSDLLKYLETTKAEYLHPEQSYSEVKSFPTLFLERIALVESLDDKLEFVIKEQNQIAGPRVYVKSSSSNYQIIRELSLPNITFISIVKLKQENSDICYYVRLFADFLGQEEHPTIIENSAKVILNEEIKSSKYRNGQILYRTELLTECPCCPITQISDDRLLIASHIKPWAKSNDFEKTDPKNGFMLSPTIDRLFDRGFLSFTDDKRIILSPFLSNMTYKRIGISDNKLIKLLPVDGREKYLDYHRRNILKK